MSLRAILPLAILLLGVLGAAVLVGTRPEVSPQAPEAVAPRVRVVEVQPQALQLRVRALGSVVPRTESELVAQVSGEVEWVAPALASGGFFEAGEALVRIDPTDYRIEVESARATLARTESELSRSLKELDRQRKLAEQMVTSEARIDDAENAAAVARAARREAQARLERARRDLERSELRAPYEGRVRSERVDVGQFVNRGQSLAVLYAVDHAEVRLPVPDRELRYLDIPLAGGPSAEQEGPQVELQAEFAGRPQFWKGRVVRTEGEIDAKTRMVHLVARVDDPYGRHAEEAEARSAPLAVGLFVEAEILGRRVEGVYSVPREALRPAQPDFPAHLHVVDAEDRLRLRPVEVLRSERERVLISAGLSPGERVSLSPLATAVDGMAVRVAETRGEPPLARSDP